MNAKGLDVGVRFSPEELSVIDAIAEEREWSRAQVVRWGFKRALAAGLIPAPAEPVRSPQSGHVARKGAR